VNQSKYDIKVHEDRYGHYVCAGRGDYKGPVGHVYADDNWIHIVTDPYEGHAMLNIETLPELIKILSDIHKVILSFDNNTKGE
jgi:hypothetical protein